MVSHEHGDHIGGLSLFSRRYKVPVYATKKTSEFLPEAYTVEHFRCGKSFSVGGLDLNTFSVTHDAVDPVGFVIESEGIKLCHVTDLGCLTPAVRTAARGVHALVIESNHDLEMLKYSDYPWELKQRIASSHGHLSNHDCAALIASIIHSDLSTVVLAHLSENCNTPDLALGSVLAELGESDLHLEAASVANPTEMIEVGESPPLRQLGCGA